MKIVLLAGGFGTRISEETGSIPKPMVTIGNKPILAHLMECYSAHGFNNFIVACGYKGEEVKKYFANFFLSNSDWSISLQTGEVQVVGSSTPDWQVRVVDTGLNTLTGGRLLRLKEHIGKERFMLTYGDGLANVDISKLLKFHVAHGKYATVTGVRPPARFGELILNGSKVTGFSEKPQSSVGRINGGFFVFEPEIFDYLAGDDTTLERDPLEKLASDGQLEAFSHDGFWQPMDTLRDRKYLEELHALGSVPWLASSE